MALGIRAKLLLTFGTMALLTAILGGFGVYGLQQLDEGGSTLYGDVLVGSQSLTKYVQQAATSRRAVLAYPMIGTPAERQALRGEIVAGDKAQLREPVARFRLEHTDSGDALAEEPVAAYTDDWRTRVARAS